MKELEPKNKSVILTRPCYADGEVWREERPRFKGEIYVYGKRAYESSDFDNEGAAFNACAKHIQWYNNKFDSNFLIDAKMDRLKA